jgi:hypothetical protein
MALCNAKNHHWNCNCGFGGGRGLLSPKKAKVEAPDLFAVPHVPRRYTKPNERCAFCDASVFFRRLANGGRVYFDDPGAPWHKHPCTDSASEFYRGAFGTAGEGWPQVTQVSAKAQSGSVLRLTGRLIDQDWSVFVSTSVFRSAPIPSTYLSESFIQARPGLGGRFELALLTPDLRRKLITGYPMASDAASGQS